MLIPVLKESFRALGRVNTTPDDDQEFLAVLAHAIDKNVAKVLNDQNGELWNIFMDVLRHCLTHGRFHAAQIPGFTDHRRIGPQYLPNAVFEEKLKGGLFDKLSSERKIALCHLLLDVGGVVGAVCRLVSLGQV